MALEYWFALVFLTYVVALGACVLCARRSASDVHPPEHDLLPPT